MADSKSEGSWLRLGHSRVSELNYCHLCIALDLLVQFKLLSRLSPCPASLIRLTLPSDPMTSIVHHGSRQGSSSTSLSLNSHYKPTFGLLTLCQVLSWGRQWQITPRARRKITVSSPNSMESASSLPNQTSKRGVCDLTTSRSRSIQPSTATNPAQPTRPITAAISFKQFFKTQTSESLPFNGSSKS